MTTIETSELTRSDGSKVACSVVHGWNPKASLECDTMWKQASLELLSHIMAQNYSDKELIEVRAAHGAEVRGLGAVLRQRLRGIRARKPGRTTTFA